MRMISLVVLLLPETSLKDEEICAMKGSGDDDNHRLGEMCCYFLFSLVLFFFAAWRDRP